MNRDHKRIAGPISILALGLLAGAAGAAGAATGAGTAPAAGADSTLADAQVTQAVRDEMEKDPRVTSRLLDISTLDGVVTLSGTADNLLAGEYAVELAETTRGVTAVIDRIVVDAPVRPDHELRADVEAALREDPATQVNDLDVAAADGAVTLGGTVQSWAEKRLSGLVASGVRGVKQVDNRIEVDFQTFRLDGDIKAVVQRRLDFDVWVDSSLLAVAVAGGKVELRGVVRSPAEKAKAELDAWVAGVKSVDGSGIKIDYRRWRNERRQGPDKIAAVTDEQIRTALEEALQQDPRVHRFETEVRVAGGIVTLTGIVDNLMASTAAERDARQTVGVWRVRNFLLVRPAASLSDGQIELALAKAIRRDPYLDPDKITLEVAHAVAYLNGYAHSDFEKARATEVAARTTGVVEVVNLLEVQQAHRRLNDWELRNEIESQLFWSPYVDSSRIQVRVDDGVATLTGTVSTWHEKLLATENAVQGGAVHVVNELEVESGGAGARAESRVRPG